MSIVIGFGKTETEQRKEFFGFVKKKIKELLLKRREYDYNNIEEEITDIIRKKSDELETFDKKYTENDYKETPERYYFIMDYGVARDFNDLFIGIEFWHINTHHSLSPDGIALMKYRETIWLNLWELQIEAKMEEKKTIKIYKNR